RTVGFDLDGIVGDELVVRHPRRRDEESCRAAHADVSGHAGREAERAHPPRGRDQLVAQPLRHANSGNSAASPAGPAMPRSVFGPVPTRRGVTSNAGFATGLPAGTTSAPRTKRTSSASRSSIGISPGSPTRQSMLGDGAAT